MELPTALNQTPVWLYLAIVNVIFSESYDKLILW